MVKRPTFEHFDAELARRMTEGRSKKGIDAYLGIRVEEFEAGRLVAAFDVTDELVTMIGNIHGGCLAALCDHCLGVIMYPVMPARSWAATTEFKLNYLAPVKGGTCRATAEIVSMTRRLAVIRVEVENEGRLVCVAQGTSTIVAPKGEQG